MPTLYDILFLRPGSEGNTASPWAQVGMWTGHGVSATTDHGKQWRTAKAPDALHVARGLSPKMNGTLVLVRMTWEVEDAPDGCLYKHATVISFLDGATYTEDVIGGELIKA